MHLKKMLVKLSIRLNPPLKSFRGFLRGTKNDIFKICSFLWLMSFEKVFNFRIFFFFLRRNSALSSFMLSLEGSCNCKAAVNNEVKSNKSQILATITDPNGYLSYWRFINSLEHIKFSRIATAMSEEDVLDAAGEGAGEWDFLQPMGACITRFIDSFVDYFQPRENTC
jgi:hypothetical protein